ncbi:MAG: 4-hydroxy-tetrahydrodipicolinate reductase [Alphaproteobacteria bacterium]
MKIGVVGAAGRMGGAVIRQVTETDGCAIAAASEVEGSPAVGRDAGELAGIGAIGITVSADAQALFADSDAVIEFSSPAATIDHAGIAAAAGCIHIIGTTGLDGDQERALAAAAEKIAIVHAPNMSLAVNILFALTRQVAHLLDDEFDIEIVEMHHRHKVDAPSGTALGLGRAAAAGRGVDLDTVSQMVREGHTGPRKRGDIGFATLRGGDVVGDHSVIFAADGERMELVHKAAGRQIFARGAVRAALWSRDKSPGLYSMHDVIGLSD